jgi:chromosome segregation ATPase
MRKCAFGRFAVWTLAVAAGLIGAGFFLGFGSHMRTAWKSMKAAVAREVPPEFEIARIRGELDNIDKDLASNFDALAHETVQVRGLKDEIAGMKTRLDKQKRVVLSLRHDLDSGNKRVSIGDVEYTPDELKVVLAREFDGYKTAEGAVKAKEEELKARLQGLQAGRDKIDAMRNAKEQLSAELAKIEAEYKRIQVVETKSPFQVDDSRLSRIKQSMKDLKNRVDEMDLKNKLQAEFGNHQSIVQKIEEKNKTDNVLKEIDKHFGTTPDKVVEK